MDIYHFCKFPLGERSQISGAFQKEIFLNLRKFFERREKRLLAEIQRVQKILRVLQLHFQRFFVFLGKISGFFFIFKILRDFYGRNRLV